MKSYKAIAEETGTTIEQVRAAMACAGKTRDNIDCLHPDWPEWFVSAGGAGRNLFWIIHVQGWGETREEAVIDALTKHPELF